jgi:hypothetical protein
MNTSIRNLLLPLAAVTGVTLATPALANYTTIDIGSYVNSNVAINANTFPTGISSSNQGLSVPFNIAVYGSAAGTWNPDYAAGNYMGGPIVGTSLTVSLTSLTISGQASFYALLNNYYGTPGANEYNITIKATNGDTVTYQSIGGVDTRDYNANVFTNTIANTTTGWFDNGIGQRLDVREFVLPVSFATETIDSFTITQEYQGSYGDAALFSGLTFSTDPLSFGVPEPASLSLFGLGLAGMGFARRRKVS